MDAEDRIAQGVEIARRAPSTLLCVVGPTASGKTELAVSVAERVGGEIVSADSVQIYRGFDIGSGKPSAEELQRAPHHLVGTLDPRDDVDAAAFARMADAALADVRARGRIPILCGGTFLWVRALVLGLAPAPPGDTSIRARHQALVAEKGAPALHAALAEVDPASAARLHPNDVLRTSRALEVFELSGRPMSDWQAEHGFREARIPHVLMAPHVEPDVLASRIGARVDGWLAGGWIEEVQGLLDAGYRDTRAMGSVGYKEVCAHLDGRLPREELRDKIVQSTRIFVRRQRTWLKQASVTWV